MKMTLYCVQPYRRDGLRLAREEARRFRREHEARREGWRASRRYVGVVVFVVHGDDEWDLWSKPRVIATHGTVPP